VELGVGTQRSLPRACCLGSRCQYLSYACLVWVDGLLPVVGGVGALGLELGVVGVPYSAAALSGCLTFRYPEAEKGAC